MDIVTKNLIDNFRKQESLEEDVSESVLFEHFSNYCIVSNQYGEEFDLDDVHTGGGNDLGIDGLAIIVNGTLVIDVQEIEDLATTNKFVEAEFIFCQAKSGKDFDASEISNFCFGIKDLFDQNPKLPRNEKMQKKEDLVRAIYKKSHLFKKGNPKLLAFFVTTGKWQDDAKLVARIKSQIEEFRDMEIFSDTNFEPVDARRLQKYYSHAKNRLSKTVLFPTKVTLPQLPNVQESYLGFLDATEYLKLITDESGGLARSLFYDNVRDFQGENPVNQEIDETLQTDAKQLFVLLNNGITIVADSITKTGDRFTIEDFQIVNGCQTSHVLFNNKDKLDGSIQVPIKLIVAANSEVKNQVIKATNRQTPVKTEELTALTDFQKSLEDYYAAIGEDYRLYYERRSQQYRSAVFEKIRIVSISNQIRAFSSMFLKVPHQASRYYGTLLKGIEGKIFHKSHHPNSYYISAYALYKFEAFVRRKSVEYKYRPFRYHILGLIPAVHGFDLGLSLEANKFQKQCDALAAVLQDDKLCLELMQNAILVMDSVLSGDYDRDKAKDASLLQLALDHIKS